MAEARIKIEDDDGNWIAATNGIDGWGRNGSVRIAVFSADGETYASFDMTLEEWAGLRAYIDALFSKVVT